MAEARVIGECEGCELRGVDLREANLNGVNLSDARRELEQRVRCFSTRRAMAHIAFSRVSTIGRTWHKGDHEQRSAMSASDHEIAAHATLIAFRLHASSTPRNFASRAWAQVLKGGICGIHLFLRY
jgi:hypothetical protein